MTSRSATPPASVVVALAGAAAVVAFLTQGGFDPSPAQLTAVTARPSTPVCLEPATAREKKLSPATAVRVPPQRYEHADGDWATKNVPYSVTVTAGGKSFSVRSRSLRPCSAALRRSTIKPGMVYLSGSEEDRVEKSKSVTVRAIFTVVVSGRTRTIYWADDGGVDVNFIG